MVEYVLVWGGISQTVFPCRALQSSEGSRDPQPPKLLQGARQSRRHHCCIASRARKDLWKSPSWFYHKKIPLVVWKLLLFWAVFSGIPLAQWILNREVATATPLGCWKEGGFTLPLGTGLYDCFLRCNACSYVISLCCWNPHCHCACFWNWAHFWRRCHSKASRGMNFNEYIGLPTCDIPSDGIT